MCVFRGGLFDKSFNRCDGSCRSRLALLGVISAIIRKFRRRQFAHVPPSRLDLRVGPHSSASYAKYFLHCGSTRYKQIACPLRLSEHRSLGRHFSRMRHHTVVIKIRLFRIFASLTVQISVSLNETSDDPLARTFSGYLSKLASSYLGDYS
jgi:hypothetical protein